MLARIEIWIRHLKKWTSRTEWMIRLLGFPTYQPSKKALILIQIDGLSRNAFEKALSAGYLPFLKRLYDREHYRKWPFYSRVPSNTPSVQGEIFYGVPQCVPSFQFRDKKTGKIFTMFDSHDSFEVEQRLKSQGEGLLKGGSCYANIFAGDASESHFCASTGWQGALKAINLYSWLVIIILHIDIILYVTVLILFEIFLAVLDLFEGLINGFEFWDEVKFIPTRVAVSIVMRELITTYAKVDIARGLSIIHLNYFGYDEQAHRRGPYSRFANWTLKGIDGAIKRVWEQSHQSTKCHYDVWIYSDHGQVITVPYAQMHGRKFKDAVKDLSLKMNIAVSYLNNNDNGFPESYGRYSRVGRKPVNQIQNREKDVLVAAMGPVANIYFPNELEVSEKKEFARALVQELKVPMVAFPEKKAGILCFTERGEFRLPEDKEEILGSDHPYLKEVTDDLINLCAHPEAGAFILFGWCSKATAISFPIEHGAHGGFAPDETDAFALLPADTRFATLSKHFLRPCDLREAALIFLDRMEKKAIYPSRAIGRGPDHLRIMTYNVHGCRGMDGKLSPERIARIISRQNPDVIALQELNAGGPLGLTDVRQAEMIATQLRMNFNFHPVINLEKKEFGNAILSGYPMKLIKAETLPGRRQQSIFEPRGALLVELDFNYQKVLVLNTHLSLWWIERKLQIDTLLGPQWLGCEAYRDRPVILCGDFNATEQSYVFRKVTEKFKDAQQECIQENERRKTWSGRLLLHCLDHVFLSPHIQTIGCRVPSSELEKLSSDHLPLVVDIQIPAIDPKDAVFKPAVESVDSEGSSCCQK